MIKAVFLDLDDTLIQTNRAQFFSSYLETLGDYASRTTPPNEFVTKTMTSYSIALNNGDPIHTLEEKFLPVMAAAIQQDPSEVALLYRTYYAECYAALAPMVRANPLTREVLDWLVSHEYPVVVATNPGLPAAAITQRMEWGEIPAADESFALITTLENMHFGKPNPEYYEEIMAHLALAPGEAIMVGDDWENDIVGAAMVGLHTFWINNNSQSIPDPDLPISAIGSYQSFVGLLKHGWLETLGATKVTDNALTHRLAAFPASLDALRRAYRPELLECHPAAGEWSARHIVCHLRDHEAAEDRMRLERIVNEDKPFLSTIYDPWAHAHNYDETSTEVALYDFARSRSDTVSWLNRLPAEAWQRTARHSIFGPTTFSEMVRFTTEHDLTHLRQIRKAIESAIIMCGN